MSFNVSFNLFTKGHPTFLFYHMFEVSIHHLVIKIITNRKLLIFTILNLSLVRKLTYHQEYKWIKTGAIIIYYTQSLSAFTVTLNET